MSRNEPSTAPSPADAPAEAAAPGAPRPVTRRRFLTAAATAAAAAPSIIPATALGRGGRPAPSERVNLACIGYGTIAHGTTPGFLNDERVQVVAVADPAKDLPNYGYGGELRGGREVGRQKVEAHYGAGEKKGKYKGCRTYVDYRKMLEQEDVDAVQVSTPDHWHALCTIDAARRGIHIYGQKPLALTVAEGRAMATAVAEAGVTFQTGSQQRSEVYFRQAAEFVRNGRIGKVHTIKVGLPGGHTDWNQQAAHKDPADAPGGLDYALWQGPAPERAYRPAILPLNWRHNFDYSGGMITDWGAHHVDIVQWALGMDASGPVRFDGVRGELPPADALFNTPGTFHFACTYADGTRLIVADTSVHRQGITFEGEGGRSIFVQRGNIETHPADLRRDKIRDDEVRLYVSRNHQRNFVDCIYSGRPPVAPVEAAHRTISVAHLANIALRLGRDTLMWDPAAERVVGDPDAQAMLSRPMRPPYKLG